MLPYEPASFDDMKDKISAEAKVNWSDNCYAVLCSYLDTLLDNDLNRRWSQLGRSNRPKALFNNKTGSRNLTLLNPSK